eukprot:864929-Pyramimonas_sp.AAC.1
MATDGVCGVCVCVPSCLVPSTGRTSPQDGFKIARLSPRGAQKGLGHKSAQERPNVPGGPSETMCWAPEGKL